MGTARDRHRIARSRTTGGLTVQRPVKPRSTFLAALLALVTLIVAAPEQADAASPADPTLSVASGSPISPNSQGQRGLVALGENLPVVEFTFTLAPGTVANGSKLIISFIASTSSVTLDCATLRSPGLTLSGVAVDVNGRHGGCESVEDLGNDVPRQISITATTGSQPNPFSISFLQIERRTPGTPDIVTVLGRWDIEVRASPAPMNPMPTNAAPDPIAAVVATAREQASAAGVAGSSQGVLVRKGAVVPVTSRVSPSVGPRGGVVLEAAGLRVAVASSAGARADSGVVVPSGGDVELTISGRLVPGAVVEVWVNSDPRLVAAARVPTDYEDGDSLTFLVPTGAPLDGGEAVEEGEHTLQLLMYMADGFEVLSTGLTVGGVVPTGIPAGEGPVRLDGVLLALLGAAGLAGFAVRRAVVSG
jgi:hypothetical protein